MNTNLLVFNLAATDKNYTRDTLLNHHSIRLYSFIIPRFTPHCEMLDNFEVYIYKYLLGTGGFYFNSQIFEKRIRITSLILQMGSWDLEG